MKKIMFVVFLSACVVGDDPDDASEDTSNIEAEVAGNADHVNIGFNSGADGAGVGQFAFYPDFFGASSIHPGPRICHTYAVWNVADEPAAMGNGSSPAGHRAALEYWLAHAQTDGHCEEVLVSFQAHAVDGHGNPKPGARCPDDSAPPCDPPTEAQVKATFVKFLETDWAGETGYTGAFAFTPWNEPNNQYGAGNGLGKVISPERAAKFYLTMERQCVLHGCKVAAGDLASNGSWPADFEWNCANDNIANLTVTHADGSKWCRHPSSKNPGNQRPASWLDRYKNYIALHAADYPGVPDRPKYFAFHPWHDLNSYVESFAHCTDYENCVTRRLLKNLSGSWGGVELWDTEIGVSQGPDISNERQACGAAFLLRLSTISSRITRIYYTRLHNGGIDSGGSLVGGTPWQPEVRPANGVLAKRETHYSASCR